MGHRQDLVSLACSVGVRALEFWHIITHPTPKSPPATSFWQMGCPVSPPQTSIGCLLAFANNYPIRVLGLPGFCHGRAGLAAPSPQGNDQNRQVMHGRG